MDKRATLKAIALALLDLGDNNSIIEGRDLDRLTFEKSGRLDRNIKYEFRNYLFVFSFINQYRSPDVRQNDAFIIEKENIKKFYGVD